MKDSSEINDKISERSLLQKDNKSFYLFQKAERLISALYLVTDLLPEGEPLRTSLRSAGLAFLSTTARWNSTKSEQVALELSKHGAELLGVLRVASTVGYISAMNSSILCKELHDFFWSMTTTSGEEEEREIHLDFFVPEKEGNLAGSGNVRVDTAGTHSWIANAWQQPYEEPFFLKGRNRHSNKTAEILETHTSRKRTASYKGHKGNIARNGRKERILSIVREKKKVSIKDVAAAIQGCSEKTLQRDLSALVQDGVLKREGERRWSTYLLA